MLKGILLLAVVVFVAYAMITQYTKSPIEDSIPHRVWISIVAAAAAISALVTSWLHTGATP